MIVPTDPRPQLSQMMLVAKNLDANRSPMAGARQTLPGVDRWVKDPHVIGRVPGGGR
jgi:hypothetical protein